jgi:hypothetical protein
MKLNPTLLKLISLIQAHRDFMIDEGILTESSDNKTDWWTRTKEYYYSLDRKYFEAAGIPQNEWYFQELIRYDITKEIDKTVYDELGKFPFPNENETNENIVSSFFYYMWNAWYKDECQKTFGWEWEHFWNKWIYHTKETAKGAAEKLYADLDTGNRIKLVKRACEVYDGSGRRKIQQV